MLLKRFSWLIQERSRCGFVGNAAFDPKIDGSWLVSRSIVYVSNNYHLAPFGFTASPEIAEAGQTQEVDRLTCVLLSSGRIPALLNSGMFP